MKAAAVACWAAAWICSGFIVAAFLAAAKGDVRRARIDLAIGVVGASVLAWTGVALW